MSQSPDQWVEAHLGPIAEALSSIVFYTVPIAGTDVPLIVMWTAVAGLFFTFYLGLINVRALGLAIRHARGDFADPDARGEISHFKAVATAVSGTVGVVNIGGVAVAISSRMGARQIEFNSALANCNWFTTTAAGTTRVGCACAGGPLQRR